MEKRRKMKQWMPSSTNHNQERASRNRRNRSACTSKNHLHKLAHEIKTEEKWIQTRTRNQKEQRKKEWMDGWMNVSFVDNKAREVNRNGGTGRACTDKIHLHTLTRQMKTEERGVQTRTRNEKGWRNARSRKQESNQTNASRNSLFQSLWCGIRFSIPILCTTQTD